jgi:hypothetical protein
VKYTLCAEECRFAMIRVSLPRTRTAALAAALLLASTACSGSGPGHLQPPLTEAPTTAAVACAQDYLRIGDISGGVAGGHVGLILLFENAGPRICTVTGYPAVDLDTAKGTVVLAAKPSTAGYIGGEGYRATAAVTIPNGGFASALVEWGDVPTGNPPVDGSGCAGPAATQFVVTAPGTPSEGPSLQVPADGQGVCEDLLVHPIVAGTTGRAPSVG